MQWDRERYAEVLYAVSTSEHIFFYSQENGQVFLLQAAVSALQYDF